MTSQDFTAALRWNEHPSDAREESGALLLTALPETDIFVNPETGDKVMDAPFYHAPVTGDFTLRVKASRDFVSTYDACAILMLDHNTCWAKLCFEYTDLGHRAIVTVVTNGTSDDANGVVVDGDTVWLQLARKGNLFAMHYSYDGKEFQMARFFALPCGETVKLGFVAQSPTGNGGVCRYAETVFENKCPADMRSGV
jgi:regulation of enolase protein 1 (concanavalin A-like superfamily)